MHDNSHELAHFYPKQPFLMKSSDVLLFQMAFNGNFNITSKPGQDIFVFIAHA